MADTVNSKFHHQLENGECLSYLEDTNRPLTEDEFRHVHHFEPQRPPLISQVLKQELLCSSQTLLNLFPILKWLPKYKLKDDLVSDIIAGLTVAIMHIPQGMAYALLGGVPAITGIYMAFFPVWVYIIMGTSRHVSMGTFAVICIMVSKCVFTYSTFDNAVITYNATDGANSAVIEVEHQYSPMEVATAVCLVVGLWQIILGILRLGCLSVLLSEALVSGFTTGAAIHVLTSQITNLLGLRIKRHVGPLKIIFTYIEIFKNLDKCNSIAIAMSTVCIIILVFFAEVVKPFVNKRFPKCTVPIPIELITIIIGTVVSNAFHLEDLYGVKIVGDVPLGLPVPSVPPLSIVPSILIDSLVIAIVAISINLSMASIFARKLKYEVDSNQEILASGFGNVFGAFFSCMPFAASLSRSLIQQTVGGKTQLTSAISCFLLLFVLLFIGPFFETLPNCVLSSIIIVALKGMLFQMKDFLTYFRYSKLDGMVWAVTFLAVVCLDIDYGLGIGLVMSVTSMIIRAQTPEIIELGQIPSSNLFVDYNTYKTAVQIPNVMILKISGGLHFGNCEQMLKTIMIKFSDLIQRSPIMITRDGKNDGPMYIVFNFISVPYIDPSAVKTLITISNDFKKNDCKLYISECTTRVYADLERCRFFDHFPRTHLFPYLQDVVVHITHNRGS